MRKRQNPVQQKNPQGKEATHEAKRSTSKPKNRLQGQKAVPQRQNIKLVREDGSWQDFFVAPQQENKAYEAKSLHDKLAALKAHGRTKRPLLGPEAKSINENCCQPSLEDQKAQQVQLRGTLLCNGPPHQKRSK